jgi:protein-tyrosine phosphatase
MTRILGAPSSDARLRPPPWNVIDLHSHILFGLDDGPETLEGSIELARASVGDGVETIAATPHVREDWPTTPAQMEAGVAAVQAGLREARIPLRVVPGGEIAYDRVRELEHEDLKRFGLAGNPVYLLVEPPYYGWPLDLEQVLFGVRAAGITPVIAHPERNGEVQADPERLRPLVAAGALVQLTASSVAGRGGRGARTASFRLLEMGCAHLISSDCHSSSFRAMSMTEAAKAVGDPALARWLTDEVPGAIVEREPLPERPATKRRRGLFGRPRRV